MDQHPLKFFKDLAPDKEPRPQQQQVLNTVEANWDKFDYFILNCPTGVGKTLIGESIGGVSFNAYFLTSTIQLQEQYEKSWTALVNLKGRGNYQCNINPAFTVDAAPCTAAPELAIQCKRNSICSYYNQKKKALESQSMITNPMYFLYSTHCGFGKDVDEAENEWKKRTVMIIDEAHNLEGHLRQFAESTIDPKYLHEEFGCATSHIVFTGIFIEDYQRIVELRDALLERQEYYAKKLETEFPQISGNLGEWAKSFSDKVADKVQKLNAKIYNLDKALQPIKIFFNTHETLEQLEARWFIHSDVEKNTVTLSPLYGNFLFYEYLHKMADKFVFMSATPGTKSAFCHELGIPQEKCLYIETDSPFEPQKSPILVLPKLKMGYNDQPQTLQKIPGVITDILSSHKGERGIIHCATYKLQDEIYRRVPHEVKSRLICRDMYAIDHAVSGKAGYAKKMKNDDMLKLHESGNIKGSVLLSPSMMEGVDLYDDLSVFQIILKFPWASLMDPLVKKKSEIDREWYVNKTWVHIMQASGRSTRHESDESVTYLLDASFPYFYSQWKHNLPKWFTDRLFFD